MAKITKRGNVWYSDFTQNGKRIKHALSSDRRTAEIKLGEMLKGREEARTGIPQQNITWDAFKVKYLAYAQGSKKPTTHIRDIRSITSLEKIFPIKQLRQITPELLEQWKAERLKRGTGKNTINREIVAIKALMHKAEAWGYIHKQDWPSVRNIKVARPKLHYHTPEALGRLLSVCHGVWRTICLLGARAGLRRSEMYWLAWEDVDFARGRIHITPKEGWEPKDYEQRFIGLAPDLRAHLEEIRPKTIRRWVLSQNGEERPSIAVMSAYFKKLSRKAGLKGSIHILRHTFASHLVQAGESLKVIKDLLGHDSMETTEIYAELAPENFDQAVMKLPPILGTTLVRGGAGKAIHGGTP